MVKATFTLAEAALLLSCHTETLRRAIKDGSLHAARLGREYRVSRVDLQNFWTARGGQTLFENTEAEQAFEDALKEIKKKDSDAKKPKGPVQLSLLEPEEES